MKSLVLKAGECSTKNIKYTILILRKKQNKKINVLKTYIGALQEIDTNFVTPEHDI